MKQNFERKIIKSALERANIPFKNWDIINIKANEDGIHFDLKGSTNHYIIHILDISERGENSWCEYSLYADNNILVKKGYHIFKTEDKDTSNALKKMLLVGTGIAAATTVVAYKLTKGKELKNPTSVYDYTIKYLDSLDLEKLSSARDLVQQEYRNPNRINDRFDDLAGMLRYIDKRTQFLKYGDNPPIGFPVHREHGCYLPNDD